MNNLQVNYPVQGSDRNVAVFAAVGLDEAALFGTGATGGFVSDMSLTALAAPANVVVTQGGTSGSTDYTYVIADVSNVGVSPASGVQTTAGNATLTAANTNIISWTGISGHTYNVYRSASSGTPSSTGLIGTVVVPLTSVNGVIEANVTVNVTATFTDTGIAATLNVPLVNTTGMHTQPGALQAQTVYTGGGNTGAGGKVTVSSATGVTLTATQFLADILVRTTGSGAIQDATPTAAALVAQVGPGIRAGAMRRLEFRNEGTGTQTIAAGTGVTLRAGNTNTIVTVASRLFTIVFTNVTPGSEAVEVISGPASTY